MIAAIPSRFHHTEKEEGVVMDGQTDGCKSHFLPIFFSCRTGIVGGSSWCAALQISQYCFSDKKERKERKGVKCRSMNINFTTQCGPAGGPITAAVSVQMRRRLRLRSEPATS